MPQTIETTQTGADRRRTQRMSIPFRIEVCGREPKGTVFQDETTTIDVNEHGCKFELAHPLGPGDLVTIRHVTKDEAFARENRPMLFQIIWAEVHEAGCTVGAMKLQDKSVWPMTFPVRFPAEQQTPSPS